MLLIGRLGVLLGVTYNKFELVARAGVGGATRMERIMTNNKKGVLFRVDRDLCCYRRTIVPKRAAMMLQSIRLTVPNAARSAAGSQLADPGMVPNLKKT